MFKRRVGGGRTLLTNNNSNNSSTTLTSPQTHSYNVNGTVSQGGIMNSHVSLLVTLAFLIGGLLGHVHGRFYYSSSNCDSNVSMPAVSTSSSFFSAFTTSNTRTENDVDGWHSIRVFYGDTQKHLTPVLETIRSQLVSAATPATTRNDTTKADANNFTFANSTTKPAITTTARFDKQGRMWFSQAKQDQAVWALLRQKTNGYFIDLAANDAFNLSNTVSLEVNAQWRGLCIEPNPMYWYNLTYYRTCDVVAAVVGKTRMEPMYFRYDAEEHGGIAGDRFDNNRRWQRNSLLQYTVPLVDILQYYRVPRVIDYLSLDVEGAEKFILEAFPFDQYNISILTVERPRFLLGLLESHGYRNLKKLTKWGETLWAHESVMSQLDLKALDNFGVKKLE
jgi:hypothetical protein